MLMLTQHIRLLLVDIKSLQMRSSHTTVKTIETYDTCYSRCLLVSTVLGGSSPNTGSSGDSGACVGPGGPGLGPPDTMLPLLLPPTSRTSQWSEVDELVEPAGRRQTEWSTNTSRSVMDTKTYCSHAKAVFREKKQSCKMNLMTVYHQYLLGTGHLFTTTIGNIHLWVQTRDYTENAH